MRIDCALRQASRSGGVRNHCHVVRRLGECGGVEPGGDQAFILAARAAELDHADLRAVRRLRETFQQAQVIRVHEDDPWCAVGDESPHLGRRQPGIEADTDGAYLHAGTERLGELDAVGGEHHDAVAGATSSRRIACPSASVRA